MSMFLSRLSHHIENPHFLTGIVTSRHSVYGLICALAVILGGCFTPIGAQILDHPAESLGDRELVFRGILAGDTHPDDPGFWNKQAWEDRLTRWSKEGYNAVIWYGPGELSSGEHVLARHTEFPEAQELTPEAHQRIVDFIRWRFQRAHELGLSNYILAQHLFYTGAFGVSRGLEQLEHESTEVSHWHLEGYPDFWRGGRTVDCGVWNEDTRAYIEALYAEIPNTYPELDGFYGFLGEPMPGERGRLFTEAILPGLQRSGRQMHYIVNQWQVPLASFQEYVVQSDYPDLWLGFHGYNSESLTDAKPYPGVVWWAEQTGLPTVSDLYPGNMLYFPLNSPRFAYEIIAEMKKVEGFAGFIYWERHISGSILGPMFREALARYASSDEPYSDEPWLERLEDEFGTRAAAEHMLEAYDAIARVIPETDALVYSGGDVLRRELRLPYEFLLGEYPWSYTASPARGSRLVPIDHYARFVARSPSRFQERNGSELDRAPFYQEAVWGSEGGSIFNTTPVEHMSHVVELGVAGSRAAESAVAASTQNKPKAERVRALARASELLSQYYQMKIAAAVAARVYAESGRSMDRVEAERLADIALKQYQETATYMHEHLDPYYIEISGSPLTEAGLRFPELIEAEQRERRDIAEIFGWPESDTEGVGR